MATCRIPFWQARRNVEKSSYLTRPTSSYLPGHLLQRRHLWQSRTIVADSTHDLFAGLPTADATSDGNVALFTVSRNVPAESLGRIVKHFQDLNPRAIGSLSYAREDGSSPMVLSYALHRSPQNALELVVPFRSSIAGIPKIALGREVSRMAKKVHDAEWAGDSSVEPEALPDELARLDPNAVSQIVYFSDEQCQGLMRALDRGIPSAEKIGLLASSTPFVTGRPYTLIDKGEVHSEGAVGVAICKVPAASGRVEVDYGSLQPLGEALEVTVAKGNIIIELGAAQATKALLQRIQDGISTVIDKEQGFYLGILPNDARDASLGSMQSVRPILAGDPKRGAISLDTEANIKPGQRVRFFWDAAAQRSSEEPRKQSHPHQEATAAQSPILRFAKDVVSPGPAGSHHESFWGSSEHGFIVGRPHQTSWICSVGGSRGSLPL